jgi:very-short-patch-repair endonuclease
MAKITTRDVIKRIKGVFGDKYTFKKTVYIGAKTKIIVTCKKHGDFSRLVSDFMYGYGCNDCSKEEKLLMIYNNFIAKAKNIHGNTYDYSLVIFINYNTPVIIICKIHGKFEQTPSTHIKCGCPQCGNIRTGLSKRLTQPQVLEKFIEVHGYRYDYSLVVYVLTTKNVIIICRIHGAFNQLPKKHMAGQGCSKCAGNYKMTQHEFIEQLKQIRGEEYDYSKSIFTSLHNFITIICKTHGPFEQLANTHLYKNGQCTYCNNEKLSILKRKDIEQFIIDAKKVHGDRYDYSLVVYIKSNIDVIIICKKHGKFEQQPNNHLQGANCRYCSVEEQHELQKSNKEEFTKKAVIVHGYLYGYNLVEYIDSITKVIIVCKKHGKFEQTPSHHLSGTGCPTCKLSHGERLLSQILNSFNISYIQQKQFDGCKNIRNLKFDFYIPEHNLCIEYDGIQHFEVSNFFGGEEAFKARQYKDSIKNRYCEENKIDLLRIPYNEKKVEKIIYTKLFIRFPEIKTNGKVIQTEFE